MMKKMNFKVDYNLVNSLIEELKAKPSLKKYNINESNVNLFYLVNEEQNNCSKCSGLAMCKNKTPGFRTIVSVDKDIYREKVEQCKYKIDLNKINSSKNLIKTLFLPKKILNSDLIDFEIISEERKKIYNYAMKFISEYNKFNFMKGLYLYGPYSAGKTFFLAGLANELAKKNIKTLLIYVPDLVRELKSCMNTPRFEELINELKTVDVLMLDDLGGEMLTSFIRDEIFGPVLNYRMGEELPLFISSNLNLDELNDHFSQTKDESYNQKRDQVKSQRIFTRIESLTLFANIGNRVYK